MLGKFIISLTVWVVLVLAERQGDECQAEWKLVYEHDKNGSPLSGNKYALIASVLSGARVRIAIGNDYYTEAQGVYVRGNDVHAELLNHVSKGSWNTMQRNSYWWWVIVSTNGNYYMTRYYIGGGFLSSTNSKTSLKWFAKPGCFARPVYANDKNGKKLHGIVDNLISAVQKGHDIRGVSDKSYSFRLNNIAVGNKFVAGQNVEHVSKGYTGNRLAFSNNAYWWFTILSTKGTRDMSRWTVGSHVNRGQSSDRVSMQWFEDPCWKHVYSHTSTGVRRSGSLRALVAAIQSGKRVRFQFPGSSYYTAEADNLSIRNGHVTAQALKHVSKASLEKHQGNAYWYWLMVSTTGTVRESRYNVGSALSRGETVKRMHVDWFMDTRPWKLALEVNKHGSPTSGSKSHLIEAIRGGASVRIVQGDGLYAFPADNLVISKNDVAAQTIFSISMQSVPSNQYEMMITASPYWWFTIVDTTGRRDMSRWTVGKHVSRGHTNDKVGNKWFVDL